MAGLWSFWERRNHPPLLALPLGPGLELPWHSNVPQVRSILAAHGVGSLDAGGSPTARVRFADHTMRVSFEFADGIWLGGDVWLASTPGATFSRRDASVSRMEPVLRAAVARFEKRDARVNWKRALAWLGKPHGRLPNGEWSWRWDATTVVWSPAPREGDAAESLRFSANASARALEIVNQTRHELYRDLQVRVDFRQGTWTMGARPGGAVATRVHWDMPRTEIALVTASTADHEASAEVPRRVARVVITSDAAGTVRVVV